MGLKPSTRVLMASLIPLALLILSRELLTWLFIPVLILLNYLMVRRGFIALTLVVNFIPVFIDLVVFSNELIVVYVVIALIALPTIPVMRYVGVKHAFQFLINFLIIICLVTALISLSVLVAYGISNYTMLSEYVVEVRTSGFYTALLLMIVSLTPLVKSVISLLNPNYTLRLKLPTFTFLSIPLKHPEFPSRKFLDGFVAGLRVMCYIGVSLAIFVFRPSYITLLLMFILPLLVQALTSRIERRLRLSIPGLNILISSLALLMITSLIHATNLLMVRYDENGLRVLVKLINELIAKLELGVR